MSKSERSPGGETTKEERCRCLRTKGMYIPSFADLKDRQHESSTAVFWCLKTMTVTGPDDSFVSPETCRVGRGCYEAIA